MKIDFNHPITIAGALILMTAVATLFISLIDPVRQLYRKIRGPLRMQFYVPDSDEEYENSCTVGKGTCTRKMRIETRVPGDIALIDLRFVKGWGRWRKNAPPEIIRVVSLKKIEWGDIQVGLNCAEPNGTGGLRILLQSPKSWAAGVYSHGRYGSSCCLVWAFECPGIHKSSPDRHGCSRSSAKPMPRPRGASAAPVSASSSPASSRA